jgi:hypothetical protein
MNNSFLATALLLGTSNAMAAPAPVKKEIAKCAQMEDSVKRLECFDEQAKRLDVDKPLKKTAQVGHWKITREISKIDDSANVFLSVSADTEIEGWPAERHRPTLILRCMEKEKSAIIQTGMTPNVESGASDAATVTLRFDKDLAENQGMSESTDKKALFFLDPDEIISKMLTHKSMLFQFTPFNSSPVMTTFNLAGLEGALKPLEQACGKILNIGAVKSGDAVKVTLRDGSVVTGQYSGYDAGLKSHYMDVLTRDTILEPQHFPARDIVSIELIPPPIGIGAVLKAEGDFFRILTVVPGSPADLDKRLKIGDKIEAVAQSTGPWTQVKGMKLEQLIQLVRGESGTTVRLRIMPAKASAPSELIELSLVRKKIEPTQVALPK